ncbi:hypothetical protein ABR314_002924 [Proteus mirabilis]|uniref:hypothetical protein n=1 Tax=Proteus mirabilis TaxID=584 RepID=UPI0009418301|nr:hypothetical protein [Proteus mirabilis]MBQ0272832.1 hypothetical protein [Proteus mirabilis]MBQ0643609.1 hypothetical protein [Proteus mirabilis]NHU67297.1 hypothetical protein [Proteus mirabilis]WOQ77658.1 hypothetical protein R2B75_06830 [Proteus mirabilis]WOS04061.1 hypothetical protein R5O27_10480 [Proteus mirabilis]
MPFFIGLSVGIKLRSTILYSLFSILYSLFSILYSLFSILYSLFSILYSLYSLSLLYILFISDCCKTLGLPYVIFIYLA